jgi:hypothetical protein
MKVSAFHPDQEKQQREDPHITTGLPKMPDLFASPVCPVHRISEYIRDKEGKKFLRME